MVASTTTTTTATATINQHESKRMSVSLNGSARMFSPGSITAVPLHHLSFAFGDTEGHLAEYLEQCRRSSRARRLSTRPRSFRMTRRSARRTCWRSNRWSLHTLPARSKNNAVDGSNRELLFPSFNLSHLETGRPQPTKSCRRRFNERLIETA